MFVWYCHVSLSLIIGKVRLGGVWSEAVADLKTEGDICGCSIFSFIVVLV